MVCGVSARWRGGERLPVWGVGGNGVHGFGFTVWLMLRPRATEKAPAAQRIALPQRE